MSDEYFIAKQYTDLSLTAIHHALRASRRRLVIMLLTHSVATSNAESFHQHSDAECVSVRRLAKEIVTIEENVSLDHATGEPYHNVYTALIQTHLPELHDIDVVEYDDDRKVVAPDRNLFALSMVAAISSPVAQMLFHDAVAGS